MTESIFNTERFLTGVMEYIKNKETEYPAGVLQYTKKAVSHKHSMQILSQNVKRLHRRDECVMYLKLCRQ